MEAEQLSKLLRRPEGPTLDFKREWYKINDPNGEIKSRQRDELIKDVLALANGNASTAGEMAYLVIGAGDKLDAVATREVFDVGDLPSPRQQILQLVAASADPPLEDIECDVASLDSKRLLVITVPPTPYLHETTRRLEASSGTYNEYVVFIRRGEDIRIASAKERAEILAVRQLRYNEQRNVPPVPFGILVGAIAGGLVTLSLADKITGGGASGRIAGLIVGAVVFGLLGAMMGSLYKQFLFLRLRWGRLPLVGQAIIITVFTALMGFWAVSLWTQITR